MNLDQQIKNWTRLADWMSDLTSGNWPDVMAQARAENAWFTPSQVTKALTAIRDSFLTEAALQEWMSHYPQLPVAEPKKIGLVLAGNIPLVGFHDVLSVLLAGHHAVIKQSDKDKVLLPYLLQKMGEWDADFAERYTFVDRLKDYDAVIATGSNNSARYFRQYFGDKPHIIRENRNSVAILSGQETEEDLARLGEDVFQFFGLGCRNVSKIYVPRGYDFTQILEVWHRYNQETVFHHKYMNNFEYNIALFLLNKQTYINNGAVILTESPQIASRLACVHYEYYDAIGEVVDSINQAADQIQCVVSQVPLSGVSHFAFGQAQCPTLRDYADGVDTMDFLQRL